MAKLEQTTSIELWEEDQKIHMDIVPPLSDTEIDVLGWTGAAERMFIDNHEDPARTETWRWTSVHADDEPAPIPNIQHFVTRAFAHQVQMLRELSEHQITIDDRLES